MSGARMILGQDWASYQSATPSTSGIAFTFIKATEGTGYVSPRMASQTAHARQNGLVVGFYHFLRPGNMAAQAAYFVAKAASIEGDILAADWEDSGVTCAAKDQFIREVKRLRPTHRVVLYCNTSYWKTRDTTSYAGDGLWIADPNHAAGNPGIQADWLIQQYSSAGGVDRNVLNPAHFSTVAALKTWAGGTTPSPAAPKPTPHQEDTDMQLNDAVALNAWMAKTWPTDVGLKDSKITVRTALGSTYGHARASHEGVDALRSEVADLRAAVAKLTAALTKEN